MSFLDKRKKYHVTSDLHKHAGHWCILYGYTCLICDYVYKPSNDWRRSAVFLARQHLKEKHGG